MSKRLVGFLLVLVSLSAAITHAAVEFSPVISARFLAGQYFFQEQESSLSGNLSLLVAPAISFNPRWSVIPTISSAWRGTKSVQDLVGGGTLFQQTQDHSIGLKTVYSPRSDLQFKTGGSYRVQMLKETNDETWGKGLFDYLKTSGNIESEKSFGKELSLRLGYDLYLIDFKNYSSLESQQKDLGRENVGAKTLNTLNHSPYLGVRASVPFFQQQKMKIDFLFTQAFRLYDEQKVIENTGSLTANLRRDQYSLVNLNLGMPFIFSDQIKMLYDTRVSYSLLSSNQNNYDAAKTQFNADYYAYRELTIGPQFTFLLGQKPWMLSSGFSYGNRQYANRPAQDSVGTYLTDITHVNEYYWSASLSYPLTKNFNAQISTNFGWSRSNMKYEKTYRYNYETFTYLAGVSYDY